MTKTKTREPDALRMLCLTGMRTGPSDRYRIRQLIPYLENLGIYAEDQCLFETEPLHVTLGKRGIRARTVAPLLAIEIAWGIRKRLKILREQNRFNAIWIQRNILAGAEWLVRLIKKPFVLDVDDAVWLEGAFAARRYRGLAKHARNIIAGNECVRDWFSTYSENITIIPTSVEVDRYNLPGNNESSTFRIGWLGTCANLKYVEIIAPVLKSFLEKTANSEFVVISDRLPGNLAGKLPGKKLRFIRWTEDVEFKIADIFDLGIMPLPDDPWTRGKCAFKLLQYLSAGIPAVASPVGLSAEVLKTSGAGLAAGTDEQWLNALDSLHSNKELRSSLGAKGRAYIEDFYSTEKIAERVAAVVRSTAPASHSPELAELRP